MILFQGNRGINTKRKKGAKTIFEIGLLFSDRRTKEFISEKHRTGPDTVIIRLLKTCDPSIYTMNPSKLTVSTHKEESISTYGSIQRLYCEAKASIPVNLLSYMF